MNRRLTAVAALAVGAGLLAGCGQGPSGVTVTGTVVDKTVAAAVPSLPAAAASSAAGALGLGSYALVETVSARVGDTVTAGQVVATLDGSTLEAAVASAKADQQAAKAQVDVLAAGIEATYDKAKDVADAKAKLNKAIKTLTKTRAKLVKAQKAAKQARPKLAKQLKQAQALLAKYPPVPVPGVPAKATVKAGIAKLKAAIKKLDTGLKTIKKALPKLDKGLKKARKALKKLNDAAAKVVDARASLRDAKQVAEIAAGASGLPVDVAKAQLALTDVTAPASGVVVAAAQAGDRLAAGASVVTIRADQPAKVTAWLSPAQAAQVCLGDSARISGDWMAPGESVDASLTRIADGYAYPPTDATTAEIHLTTALEVEFTASGQLPAGVPVDVSVNGCRAGASRTEAEPKG
ncbi:MAG: HlyD family secretion protein [Propionibacteriaceae bacterium]|nr:HlyD family secretion protein [Propionibacteriaceae bacterium]